MTHANTCSIEDVLNTLDVEHRLSPYLKLRGHISFKAAKLAGQFLAKTAKALKDSSIEDAMDIDTFNAAMGYLRGQSTDDLLMDEMGLIPGDDIGATLRALVMYGNKLNFDMQEIVDPTAKKRNDPTWKARGVYFTESQQRQSWTDSVKLLAEGNTNEFDTTYAEYVALIDNPEWTLSEEEWTVQQTNDDSLFKDYSGNIIDFLMDIGSEECDFDQLPERTQVAAIENMRGKLGSMVESMLRGMKYDRRDKSIKLMEASKMKGIINGMNQLFCAMLDSSRYANFAEFMYNYSPQGKASEPVSRRMIARKEKIADTAFVQGKRDDEQMATLNDDFLGS